MFRHRLLMVLLLACPALPLQAADAAPGRGLKEIPDPELNLMRGRYTVGGNTVAWFGVTMVSQWQASNGSVLQGALTLGMDFRGGGSPKLSFQPSVHVTAADAPLPDTQGRTSTAAAWPTPAAGAERAGGRRWQRRPQCDHAGGTQWRGAGPAG
jgi:hypothetical protein